MLFVLVCFLFHSCFFYNCKKEELTERELSWFDVYRLNDTLIFQSNLLSLDSVIVFKKDLYNTDCNKLERGFIQEHVYNLQLHFISNNKEKEYNTISMEFRKINDSPCLKCFRVMDLWGYYDSEKAPLLNNEIRINNKEYKTYYFEKGEFANSFGNENIKSFHWSDKYGLVRYSKKTGEVYTLKI